MCRSACERGYEPQERFQSVVSDMLKISSQTDATHTIFELQGSLMGPWVQELEKCWRTADRDRPVKILICAVSYIDDRGKELLAEMYRNGAKLVAEGCMNQAIVKELQERKRNP